MRVLITDPDYDDTLGYLSAYTKLLLNFAEKEGIKVHHLKRPRLTKAKVSEIINKKDPSLLLFNGHGDEATIYGDKTGKDAEVLIRKGLNHQLLGKRLSYARACSAAAQLGKTAVEGGGCFIGYRTPFLFWNDERFAATPLKDATARLCLEPSNAVAVALLKGNSAKEADEKFRSISKKNILLLLGHKKEPGAMSLITAIWDNIQGQVIHGETDMRANS